MSPEPTLGEILSAALAAEAVRFDVQREKRLAARAQYLSARELAREVAPRFGCPPDEAFDALTYVPDNMLTLLHSPEGWSALAEYAAARLGVAAPGYRPTCH